ncbi:hypothetical protein Fmac_021345 [Flemingia macrophylla]|uniref:Uncharacterized protein n=1 Tax=Flemingia macrophylla TaxID=520843 RepID=A0ABD1LX31_9FABA
MGGGGVMRAAAKVPGISRSVIGAASPLRPPSQSTRCNSPVRTHTLSKEGQLSAEVAPSHKAAVWDDWDFADDGEVDVPRVLNNSVPTFEEAKEATAELKDAIDRIYFSPESSQYSSPGGEVAILSPTTDEPVSRSCVLETISSPSVPRHALEAFRMLSRSCEAQTVVASLASDPNVWNAVLENPAVTSFFKSQHSVADFGTGETTEEVEKSSSFTSESVDTPEKMKSESHPGKGFFVYMGGLLENAKLTVTELLGRVSGFLQNIFPAADDLKEKPSSDADGNTKTNYMVGGTFVGLVILVVMVIVTKRV